MSRGDIFTRTVSSGSSSRYLTRTVESSSSLRYLSLYCTIGLDCCGRYLRAYCRIRLLFGGSLRTDQVVGLHLRQDPSHLHILPSWSPRQSISVAPWPYTPLVQFLEHLADIFSPIARADSRVTRYIVLGIDSGTPTVDSRHSRLVP
jgi:hypothetical protein